MRILTVELIPPIEEFIPRLKNTEQRLFVRFFVKSCGEIKFLEKLVEEIFAQLRENYAPQESLGKMSIVL
ncbi:hypothetical protein HN954_04075 [bacterium]|jgi:hypothetical protein|nr:hypothetical protein [bacterium]MBT6831753.1 hypothetical protein [bacterium]MBT6996576.1 hypothetical protein [bacterium]MBT7772902.1 hypothetical protein [bacterium]